MRVIIDTDVLKEKRFKYLGMSGIYTLIIPEIEKKIGNLNISIGLNSKKGKAYIYLYPENYLIHLESILEDLPTYLRSYLIVEGNRKNKRWYFV
jgi:hypothetical protein